MCVGERLERWNRNRMKIESMIKSVEWKRENVARYWKIKPFNKNKSSFYWDFNFIWCVFYHESSSAILHLVWLLPIPSWSAQIHFLFSLSLFRSDQGCPWPFHAIFLPLQIVWSIKIHPNELFEKFDLFSWNQLVALCAFYRRNHGRTMAPP